MADPIQRMSRFGAVPAVAKPGGDPEVERYVRGTRGSIELTELLEAEVSRLRSGGGFTKKGLAMRKTELARDSLGELAHLEKDLEYRRVALDALRAELRVQPSTGDASAHAIQLVEIRAALREIVDLERVVVLNKAVEEGEEIIFQAIDLWPSSLGELVPREMLEDARQRWAEKKDPVLAARVRKLTDLFEKYQSTLRTSRSIIEKVGDIEPEGIELLEVTGAA